ncbi:PC-Esterase - like 4 [Theobroma cacao]|nr:PC-Esterase - like 4 [Theobroma cacao]
MADGNMMMLIPTLFTLPILVHSYPTNSTAKAMVVLTKIISNIDGNHIHALYHRTFNGKRLLQRFGGKRIMFVGDSVGYNQWLSLVCMLHSAVPKAKYLLETKGGLSTLTFPAHNVSVMFSRNDFLVDIVDDKNERILKLDSIRNGGQIWKDVDVLVFNTWNEGLQTGKKQSWDFIEEGNARHKDIDRLAAFEKALNTWAKWVNSTVDPKKTKILFQGGRHRGEAVLDKVLGRISKSVRLLNVTALSQLRKDGHPSSYGSSKVAVDCTQWCLPGRHGFQINK